MILFSLISSLLACDTSPPRTAAEATSTEQMTPACNPATVTGTGRGNHLLTHRCVSATECPKVEGDNACTAAKGAAFADAKAKCEGTTKACTAAAQDLTCTYTCTDPVYDPPEDATNGDCIATATASYTCR